jgi:ATP-dependent RNA helicase DeaD
MPIAFRRAARRPATRELALQIERELTWLYRHTGARILRCVGGMDDAQRERRTLQAGVHIVVGAPGPARPYSTRGVTNHKRRKSGDGI